MQSFVASKVSLKAGNDQLWYPSSPVEWSENTKLRMLNFYSKCKYPFRHISDIPFEEPLRSNIRRFFLSLDAYVESPNPVIPIDFILRGSAYNDFAQTLKRIKRKSLMLTWNADMFEIPDWYESVPGYRIKDIGDIFNYAYLVHWKEDSDDYKEGFLPLERLKLVPEFKETLKEILPEPDKVREVDRNEILMTLSSSMSFDTDDTVPQYLYKSKNLDFSKKRSLCKRCVICVSPENTRDTVICNIPDINRISYIDKQVLEILKQMKSHIHISDSVEVNKRLRKLCKKYSTFVHRDIKKEGITKPRELLRITLEVLKNTYPNLPAFEYVDFFDNYEVLLDDKIIKPIRGHGLGMANALTTLIQITISYLIKSRMISEGFSGDWEVLALNDDYVAAFQNDEDAAEYWDVEDEILSDLQIIRQNDKSFITHYCFVIAERYIYYESEYPKVSYQRRELYLPLACINVVQAKEYFISCQAYVDVEQIENVKQEIFEYWGFEFYPNEFNSPYLLGGWVLNKYYDVDMTLYVMDSIDIKSYHSRAFAAVRSRFKVRDRGVFTPPSVLLYDTHNIPEEYYGVLNIISKSQADEKFGKSLSFSRSRYRDYWSKVYKKRSEVFKNSVPLTFDNLQKSLIELNVDFYPPRNLTLRYVPYDIHNGSVPDIYRDPNPITALVNYYNENKSARFAETYSISFSGDEYVRRTRIGVFTTDPNKYKVPYELEFEDGQDKCIIPKSDDEHCEEYYLFPFKIGCVAAQLDWGRGYPIPRYRNPLIKKKKEVFNRLFPPKEYLLVSLLPRNIVKLISDDLGGRSLPEYLTDLIRSVEIKHDPPVTLREEEVPKGSPYDYYDHLRNEVRPTLEFDRIDKGWVESVNLLKAYEIVESDEEIVEERPIEEPVQEEEVEETFPEEEPYEDPFGEIDIVEVQEDSPPDPEENDEDYYYISMERLISNPKKYFYLYRQKAPVVVDDDKVMRYLRIMNNLLTELTMTIDHKTTEESRSTLLADIGKDTVLLKLTEDAGFFDLLNPPAEDTDTEEPYPSLFGEDW